MSLFDYIADRIRHLRLSHDGTGISQETLASNIGVAANTVSRWETGTYRPAIEDLEKLARFFGVSILVFFPPEEVPKSERISALLRTAEGLTPEDLAELQHYAEYRRARRVLQDHRGVRPGRKRKNDA